MSVALYRIDDRLVHGQVVMGWAQPLHASLIVLVDDVLARSEWEQELYRMGVPPEIEIVFADAEAAARSHASWVRDERTAILLTADITTMDALARATGAIARVNLGGIHHRPGRTQRLRYVFLAPDEDRALGELAARGIDVTAQDVPSAQPVPLAEILSAGVAG